MLYTACFENQSGHQIAVYLWYSVVKYIDSLSRKLSKGTFGLWWAVNYTGMRFPELKIKKTKLKVSPDFMKITSFNGVIFIKYGETH